ncbi:MAG TPA: nuclear transport factor 2 family protein [Candidatus Eisenbacteria bacterium]|nr:nuclear transport factor 2 family protein [Candidatus Eisenbacteria bacterium]
MLRSLLRLGYALLTIFTCLAAQNEPGRSPRQLPAPSDVDPSLTEQLRQLEQEVGDAILHKDANMLERIVGPEFTLRVADVPQSSLPRNIWMDNSLHRLKPESVEQRHHGARKLADDLAVVSVVWTTKGSTDGRDFSGDFYIVDFWKNRAGNWQIIARYSSPVGKAPDRGSRMPPPPTDIDPQLTDMLRQLEQELGEAALHGFKDTKTMERLVAPEFTLRLSDAPQRSVPRSLWGQPSSAYRIESLEERYHAARKLTDDLSVVSLLVTQKATMDGRDRSGDFYLVDIWRKGSDHWQMIARYSCPIGKEFDRSSSR